MVGRELTQQFPKETRPKGDVALRVDGLSRIGVLDNICFEVRRGEILGLAGLVGAGRKEIARAIFGIDRIDAGRLTVKDREVRITSPAAAIKFGRALTELERLEGFVREAKTVDEWLTSPRGFFEADRAFHRLLVERSDTSCLAAIMEGL